MPPCEISPKIRAFGVFRGKKDSPCRQLPLKRKPLRLESLEERVLLAVSTPEFDQIRALHPDLGLTANIGDYNVIEINAADLSVANLKSAITEAGISAKPDLIVLRTTATQNKITFTAAADEILININANNGSVTMVGFGTNPLTIDAAEKSRVINISGSTTNVNLANLTITGGNSFGGGGIYCYEGTITITDSTISGNNAGIVGGGILNSYATLTITNSTISRIMRIMVAGFITTPVR